MQIFFIILIFIVAVLLILVVLVQNSKGGGLASNMGISNQVMGVQRSTENIEKITWGLVGTLAVLSVVSGLFFSAKGPQGSNGGPGAYEPLKTQYEIPTSPMAPTGQPGGGQPGGAPGGQPGGQPGGGGTPPTQ